MRGREKERKEKGEMGGMNGKQERTGEREVTIREDVPSELDESVGEVAAGPPEITGAGTTR